MTRPLATACPQRAHSPRLVAGTGWTCADCEAGVKPSPLQAAFAARDAGMAASLHRHDENARVAAAIRQLAATGQPFSANTARAIHGVRGGVVGATFNALKAEGVIVPVGAETSTSRETHGKQVALWIGAAA